MYNQIEKYRCLLTPKRQTFNSLRAISISSLTSNLRWRSLAVFSSACLFLKILNILQVVFVYKQLYNIVFWSWHTHILGWVTTLAVNVKTSCRSSYLPCCDYCKQLPPPHRRVSILNYGMRSRDCFGFFFFLSPFFSFGDTQSPPHRRYFNLTYVEFLPEMSNVFRYSCLIRN